MALKIEAVLTVLYATVLVALISLGDRYWPNVLTGTFFAGIAAWKLWRHRRGREPHRTAWLDWLMLASALVLLAATAPQRAT